MSEDIQRQLAVASAKISDMRAILASDLPEGPKLAALVIRDVQGLKEGCHMTAAALAVRAGLDVPEGAPPGEGKRRRDWPGARRMSSWLKKLQAAKVLDEAPGPRRRKKRTINTSALSPKGTTDGTTDEAEGTADGTPGEAKGTTDRTHGDAKGTTDGTLKGTADGTQEDKSETCSPTGTGTGGGESSIEDTYSRWLSAPLAEVFAVCRENRKATTEAEWREFLSTCDDVSNERMTAAAAEFLTKHRGSNKGVRYFRGIVENISAPHSQAPAEPAHTFETRRIG